LSIPLPQRGKSLVETLTAIEICCPGGATECVFDLVLSSPAGASITTWMFCCYKAFIPPGYEFKTAPCNLIHFYFVHSPAAARQKPCRNINSD
jgi:hypothetical protein